MSATVLPVRPSAWRRFAPVCVTTRQGRRSATIPWCATASGSAAGPARPRRWLTAGASKRRQAAASAAMMPEGRSKAASGMPRWAPVAGGDCRFRATGTAVVPACGGASSRMVPVSWM